MDSKESRRKSRESVDVGMEEPEETNDNRSKEPEKSSRKVVKIQNGISSADQLKLNNNIVESTSKLPPLRSSLLISNGSQSPRVESLADSESGVSAQTPKLCPIVESASVGIAKNPSVSSCCPQNQLNHEPHLQLASSAIPNGRPGPPQQAGSSYVDSRSPNVLPADLGISHAESEMRNNVDYIFGIEKCPPKVSCETSAREIVEAGVKWGGNASSSYEAESSGCGVLNNTVLDLQLCNNIGGSIGSTSHGTCCFLRPNINGSRESEGTSSGVVGAQKQREPLERRDSSSGNEGDLSDGEDYCIYTYKGNDDEAGEPANANPGIGEEANQAAAGQPNSGRSSPEMDFLEMDFDPGPSCEQDTGDSDLASINEDIQNLTLDNVESDPVLLNDLSKVVPRQQCVAAEPATSKPRERNVGNEAERGNEAASGSGRPGAAPVAGAAAAAAAAAAASCSSPGSLCAPSTSAGLRMWEATSMTPSIGCPLHSYHNTSGDLISPGDNRYTDAEPWAENPAASIPESSNLNARKNNLSSTLYHRMMAKKLMLSKQTFNQSGDSNLESELCSSRVGGPYPVEKVMLWSEEEATMKQVTQIGTSACGTTSAINALLALDVPFSLEVLVKGVATRLRAPGTPLPKYLVSRSWAGATHKDLIRGISLASTGAAVAKFFAFYPERDVSLSHWLHYWISRGAAPIATLNLQNCRTGANIPDSWHHQMIFGVSQTGIFMTNPLECLSEQFVWHQLVSPSVLLVRRSDVLAHWNSATDLTPLTRLDQHWRKLNVLGQVVNVIRETMGERKQAANLSTGASHIRIPASYQAGITLVMRSDAAAAEELMHAEQLPLL